MKADWNTFLLGDLIHVKHGWAFKSKFFASEGEHIVLTPGNFYEKGGFKSREDKDRCYVGEYPEDYLLSKGDLIIAMTEQGAGLLGSSALIPSDDLYLHNQRLGLVTVKDEEEADLNFIYRLFNTEIVRMQISGSASGAKVRHTAPERVYRCKVKIPPLPTQQKIAHILSAYDDLIENNLQRIKLLEEMAQITYEQWFVRMKFPGHETTPIDADTGLPEGWVELPISEICTVNGNSITKKAAPKRINYIDIASVNTGSYELPQPIEFAFAPSRARRKVSLGDTIFSTVRPNRKIYALILEDDPLLVASTGFATLTPKQGNSFSFVYLSVTNQSFVDKTVSVAGGAAYPAVNQSDFEKIKIPVSSSDLITRFSKRFNQNFEMIGNLQKQNRRLKEARDILLPRLMTGLINVDDIDLPTCEPNKETT